jgi:glycosyltransferase involved in cell wall biosynthesis
MLYLGRIEDLHKRVSDLLPIAERLLAPSVDFRLTVAGDGARVQQFVSGLGHIRHLGRVRLIGPVAEEDVGLLLAQHHVLIQPSDVEGLSNSLLEAMAAGVVPVATPVGDTSAVVEDHVNGRLFQPGHFDAAAAAIIDLARNRDLLRSYRQRAWDRTAEYGWDLVGPRIRQVLSIVEET